MIQHEQYMSQYHICLGSTEMLFKACICRKVIIQFVYVLDSGIAKRTKHASKQANINFREETRAYRVSSQETFSSMLMCCSHSRHSGYSGKMSAHAPQICDLSVNRLRMLHFKRQIHTCYHNMFFVE